MFRPDIADRRRRVRASVPALALVLSGCGASDVIQASPSTYAVSAKEGLPSGGWPQAQKDAIEKAKQYCAAKGEQFSLVGEDRSGTPGFTLLTSTVTFGCGADLATERRAIATRCDTEYQSPELDPIRMKVELSRANADAPPPFEIASNNAFPSGVERAAIARWATLRDRCNRDQADLPLPPAAALNTAILQQERSFGTAAAGRVGELVIALYDGRLTYGEFAQKRYEISRDASSAERQFRAATLIADHARQVEAQQAAQQQFQNNLLVWSSYMQSLNARQPQTCSSMATGNLVTTHCY